MSDISTAKISTLLDEARKVLPAPTKEGDMAEQHAAQVIASGPGDLKVRQITFRCKASD